jgi:hypothetical protein
MNISIENIILNSVPGFIQFDLSQKIDVSEFFNFWRARFYEKDKFIEIPDQEAIKKNILEEDITFIIGNPLSGKTRAVFESLKEFHSGFFYKLNQNVKLSENIVSSLKKDAIYFIDDIDQSIDKYPEIINSMLTQIIKNSNKLIITCRTGPEYNLLISKLNKQILPVLTKRTFIIKRLSHSNPVVREFLKKYFEIKPKEFDFNIGSLFIPLDDMRERYKVLLNKENKLPSTILKGLKFHHHLYNYENNKRTYDIEKIKVFCKKYLNEDIGNYEWDTAIGVLKSTIDNLNFIDIGEFISIEEAYLETYEENISLDVIESTYTPNYAKKLFKDLYKDPFENKALGFKTTTRDFNELIKQSDDFKEGLDVFNKMISENLIPDSYTFLFLMQKTDNWEEISFLYEQMTKHKVDPRIFVNSVLSGKITSFSKTIDLCVKYNPNFFKQKKIGNVVSKLKKIGICNSKENLKYLFEKFDAELIFHNPNLLVICEHLVVDNEDFQQYIYSYFDKLNTVDKPLLKPFIKMSSKTGNKSLTINILNDYFDDGSFYYLKEMANSIKEEQPFESLKLYLQAFELATNNREKALVATNYTQAVYENNITIKIDFSIQLCYKVIKQTKIDHASFPYLRYILILLEIKRTNIEELELVLKRLCNRKDITKNTVRKIVELIDDENKKGFVEKYLKSSVNNV